MNILRRWLGHPQPPLPASVDDDIEKLRARIADLEQRLRSSEATVRERSEALYMLQRQYSSEHFDYAESQRNLNIERMRNAGAYAAQDVVFSRYKSLQARIADLKRRLRAYEAVEEMQEDEAPIVLDQDDKSHKEGEG